MFLTFAKPFLGLGHPQVVNGMFNISAKGSEVSRPQNIVLEKRQRMP